MHVGLTSAGPSRSFVQVMSSGATAAVAGMGYSMVLKKDGSVWAAGKNSAGQLGDGTKAHREIFFCVLIPPAIAAVVSQHTRIFYHNFVHPG